jgi:hypothetical protein
VEGGRRTVQELDGPVVAIQFLEGAKGNHSTSWDVGAPKVPDPWAVAFIRDDWRGGESGWLSVWWVHFLGVGTRGAICHWLPKLRSMNVIAEYVPTHRKKPD